MSLCGIPLAVKDIVQAEGFEFSGRLVMGRRGEVPVTGIGLGK